MGDTKPNYRFTAYISEDAAASEFISELRSALHKHLDDDQWELEVVNVLEVPEKALQKDIFATPTLTRDLPGPLTKILINARKINEVLIAIINKDDMQGAIL